jgi:hypothetical protein
MEGSREWDVEEWYGAVERLTFPTLFVALCEPAIRAVVAEDRGSLTELQEELQAAVDALGGSVFVRLSSLSPKDAVKKTPARLVELLRPQLETCVAGDYTRELLAINRTCYLACRVDSGAAALDLLLASERCRRHLDSRMDEKQVRVNVVVRRWQHIRPEYEFRGYVAGKRLVALSHYYKFLYCPEIVLHANAIRTSVARFFEEHGASIPLEDFVCDFYCDPEEEGKVSIIELNPWAPNTSSALFDWDADLTPLRNSPPREMLFRYLEQPLPNAASLISPFWRALLAVARGEGSIDAPAIAASDKAVRKAKRLCREAARGLKLVDGTSDIAQLEQVVCKRQFVTCADLQILSARAVMSGGSDFSVPTAVFCLYAVARFGPKRESFGAALHYLSARTDLEELFHNARLLMKGPLGLCV